MFEKFKARRAEKKAIKHLYDQEEDRLRIMLAQIHPLDDDYDKLQGKLKTTVQLRADSKESKRKICKSDRGGIIMKLIGGVGAISGILLVSRYEQQGDTWTGEKRTFVDSVTRVLGNMFQR